MKVPSVCCLLASGFEEIEALVPVDVLRRAGGTVVLATVEKKLEIRGCNGILVTVDTLLSETAAPALSRGGKPQFDVLMIPGGREGVSRLREDGRAQQLAAAYEKDGAWVAAICAGPIVLSDAGLLEYRRFTAHSSLSRELPYAFVTTERVVVDRRIVTSRGAGTALDFGLTLVGLLMGTQKMEEISHSIMA
ncbi:Chaperone protein YajL [Candidatus Xiphinematobacter sp. Idaho Grape]|uniref:DJ-1 family glyoxalase III n=1 Tax=Candidatus Xiphinematobacter sp. Idaho Grape TaxID=1704307 RepID=UPI000706E778|nr:DJ-1 family glyoxalase III [Candidatus Xiphinematobacter sp. Idaho Grape]ALJ56705.1 Chaperone protein YajL [Candidatus Xiphinematobacter sp. Idaho Grape]